MQVLVVTKYLCTVSASCFSVLSSWVNINIYFRIFLYLQCSALVCLDESLNTGEWQ